VTSWPLPVLAVVLQLHGTALHVTSGNTGLRWHQSYNQLVAAAGAASGGQQVPVAAAGAAARALLSCSSRRHNIRHYQHQHHFQCDSCQYLQLLVVGFGPGDAALVPLPPVVHIGLSVCVCWGFARRCNGGCRCAVCPVAQCEHFVIGRAVTILLNGRHVTL
jgi:hypothetical protein